MNKKKKKKDGNSAVYEDAARARLGFPRPLARFLTLKKLGDSPLIYICGTLTGSQPLGEDEEDPET